MSLWSVATAHVTPSNARDSCSPLASSVSVYSWKANREFKHVIALHHQHMQGFSHGTTAQLAVARPEC